MSVSKVHPSTALAAVDKAGVSPETVSQGEESEETHGGQVSQGWKMTQPKPWVTFIVLTFIILPAVVLFLAILFGGLLISVEDWEFKHGFYYVLGNLLGLATPLWGGSPATKFGKFLDVLVSVWSLSLCSAAIGVVGSMRFIHNLVDHIDGERLSDTTQAQLRAMYEELNHATDNDELSFDLFNSTVKKVFHKSSIEGIELKRIFSKFDIDHSGKLSREEAQELLSTLAKSMDSAVISGMQARMLADADIEAEMHAQKRLLSRCSKLEEELRDTNLRISSLEAMVKDMAVTLQDVHKAVVAAPAPRLELPANS